MVAYYEAQKGNPPASILPRLAKSLDVRIDELFGVKPMPEVPRDVRLLKRLKGIEQLRPSVRRDVLRLIDAFLKSERDKKRAPTSPS